MNDGMLTTLEDIGLYSSPQLVMRMTLAGSGDNYIMVHDIELSQFSPLLILSSHLLPHTDVSLLDEDTGVVNRLGEPELEHLGLQPALHEVLGLEGEHVVELHLVLGQYPGPNKATQQCISLKQSSWILFIQGEQLSSCGSDLCKTVFDTPDLKSLP